MHAAHTLLIAAALATAGSALAQNYPTRPIRIVVVSTPGGNQGELALSAGG